MSNYPQHHHKTINDHSTQVSQTHIDQDRNLDFNPIDRSSNYRAYTNKNANRSLVHLQHSSKSPNIRRSLKDGEKTLPQQQSNPSFLHTKTDMINKLHKDSQIADLNMENGFECYNCNSHKQSPCTLCLGNKVITKDSALIKFFSYLIEFKFGRKDSYTLPQQTQRSNNRLSRTSIKKQNIRVSLNQRKSYCQNIHYNYFCNECNNYEPIKGSRFQCLSCQDYDLCEECFRKKGHKHEMNEIKQSFSYRNSIKCIQKINKQQQLCSSMKISSIKNRIDYIQEKVCRNSLK